jgi:hypothetical protein
MVIGAAKCASSSLCEQLAIHPEVFFVACKEPHYFSANLDRGPEWYESLYAAAGPEQFRGEGSNSYTMKECFPGVARRIAEYDPERKLRLIYIVRDPITRIESYWVEKMSHGDTSIHHDFNKAVRENCDWFVDPSNYLKQLDEYKPYYDDSQILVVFFEDFIHDQLAVLRRCFEFLGADPSFEIPDRHVGPSEGKVVPRPIFNRLRRLPFYRSVAALAPKTMRSKLKARYLHQKVKGRPEWDRATRLWVADVLAEDSRTFLEKYGKPADFWSVCHPI